MSVSTCSIGISTSLLAPRAARGCAGGLILTEGTGLRTLRFHVSMISFSLRSWGCADPRESAAISRRRLRREAAPPMFRAARSGSAYPGWPELSGAAAFESFEPLKLGEDERPRSHEILPLLTWPKSRPAPWPEKLRPASPCIFGNTRKGERCCRFGQIARLEIAGSRQAERNALPFSDDVCDGLASHVIAPSVLSGACSSGGDP